MQKTIHNTINPAVHPWLADHKIKADYVVPAAVQIEMALSVTEALSPPYQEISLKETTLLSIASTRPQEQIEFQLNVEDQQLTLMTKSTQEDAWQQSFKTVRRTTPMRVPEFKNLYELQNKCTQRIPIRLL